MREQVSDIVQLLEKKKKQYLKKKAKEYKEQGIPAEEAINKANQSWRAYIGSAVQRMIYDVLKRYFERIGVKITTDRELLKKELCEEKEKVKRALVVNYGRYMFLPDADIVVYKVCKGIVKVIAIISVKNSFRERGFETTYWKLKLKESSLTSHIKVFVVTPDRDGEISFSKKEGKPRKMRIILEHELDGLYFLKDYFEKTVKAKHFNELLKDLEKLSDKTSC